MLLAGRRTHTNRALFFMGSRMLLWAWLWEVKILWVWIMGVTLVSIRDPHFEKLKCYSLGHNCTDSEAAKVAWTTLNLDRPMLYSTDLGTWHTFLAAKSPNTFKVCSTLMTNYTLQAGSTETLDIIFSISPKSHYRTDDR
jgi:hypothetical protein